MIAFSHAGMYVTDLEKMVDFYTRVLGLLITDRGTLGDGTKIVFMSGDPDQHHQVVLASGRPADPGFNVVNQMSFKVDTLGELRAMHTRLRKEGIDTFRIVTHGNAWSVYCGDPEGNRIELFVDTPWHTPQPFAEPFDIEKPAAEIEAETEKLCRNRPGFATRSAWRKEISARLAAR